MKPPDHNPRIVVLTAPSGSGKTTIANRINGRHTGISLFGIGHHATPAS